MILYPDQQYFNITRAAGWSGALFDGKIRVPTKGLTAVTPELNAILGHELTHAFLASLPAHCPGWFNEGLAQLQENRSASSAKKALAGLRQTGRLIRRGDLQGSFAGFSADKAKIAYMESLSAVEFLVARFGRVSMRSILDLMTQNLNFENSFIQVVLHYPVRAAVGEPEILIGCGQMRVRRRANTRLPHASSHSRRTTSRTASDPAIQ